MRLVDNLKKRRAEKLLERGHALLREARLDEALEVSDRLRELRNSGAFEIGAMAHAAKGDLEGAVRVLEEGLEHAPGVWLNWQLLGNYLSDLERFPQAATAYERALACPNAGVASVRLNQAILAQRRGDFEAALGLIELVDDPELSLQAASVHVGALAAIRDLDNVYSDRAEYYRLLVQGKFAETESPGLDVRGFFCTYDVVADSPAEALQFIQRLERREPIADLSIEESRALEPRPRDPKGVYWCSGRTYYDQD